MQKILSCNKSNDDGAYRTFGGEIHVSLLSVIVPTLNAAHYLQATLQAAHAPDLVAEHLVVDCGSEDKTRTLADRMGAKVLIAEKGRGQQLIAGADAAKREWLLFLHADTVLQPGWVEEVQAFIIASESRQCAATFSFALDDSTLAARRLEALVAWRSRQLSLPYGDQGLLISRSFYDAIDGYKPIPLFEDVDIVRRIGRDRLSILETKVVTSAAKFRKSGYLRRSTHNLICLALYYFGIPPAEIARFYGRKA